MTTLHVLREGEELRALTVSGHAGYAKRGEDIVCAAASVLITTCANALETVAGVKPRVEREARSAMIRVELPGDLDQNAHHDAQVILKTALQGFEDLSSEYPNYFTIIDGRTSRC
ncbi:MAG: ribosomal-processing cysteine protease Prp [Candidatus Limiplasma sp.]|nr:ribosomal-processing cysteine protease Prp [Candidatus Limiplasma sp.]